jgi:hypothetical protein
MIFIALGSAVTIGGWLFLLLGVGTDAGSLSPIIGIKSVVNLHLLTIASNVIYLGYFLISIGVLLEAMNRVGYPLFRLADSASFEPALEGGAPNRSAAPNRAIAFEPSGAEQAVEVSDQVRDAIRNEFKADFGKEVAVGQDGSITLKTILGSRTFRDRKEARMFLLGL